MTIIWVVVIFLVGLILSIPIGIVLGLACITPSFIDPTFAANLSFVARYTFSGINVTATLAVPLFMLSGSIMTHGGLAKRLFDIFALITGRFPGGMPSAVVVTCLFYGAISGSGAATTAAVGAMCIPLLLELGYDKKFCGALVASAAGLGVIIPPSVPFICYALAADVSLTDMFISGIIPGILIAVLLIAYTIWTCKRNGEDTAKIAAKNAELKQRGVWRVLKDGFWALMTPVIILGGIYSGVVTPTEAACISVFYSLLVCLLFYKSVNFKILIQIFKSAVQSFAPMGIMFALALAFIKVIVLLGIPDMIGDFILSYLGNKYVFLLVINVIFLLLGMVIDTGPAILIIAPMFIPAAEAMGIDLVQLGIVLTANLAIGFVTPPFGTNLFVAAPIVRLTPLDVGKRTYPFVGCLLIALALLTYVPFLSTCLI